MNMYPIPLLHQTKSWGKEHTILIIIRKVEQILEKRSTEVIE